MRDYSKTTWKSGIADLGLHIKIKGRGFRVIFGVGVTVDLEIQA